MTRIGCDQNPIPTNKFLNHFAFFLIITKAMNPYSSFVMRYISVSEKPMKQLFFKDKNASIS